MLDKIKTFFNTYLRKDSPIVSPTQTFEGDILSILDTLKPFKFKEDYSTANEDEVDQIGALWKFIQDSYLKLFWYVLTWEFLSADIQKLIDKVDALRSSFDEMNIESNKGKEFQRFFSQLRTLMVDIKILMELKNNDIFKRENLISINSKSITQDFDSNENEEILEIQLYKNLIYIIRFAFAKGLSDLNFIRWYLLDTLEDLKNLKKKGRNIDIIQLLIDFVYLNLYKLSLTTWEKNFSILLDGIKTPIEISKWLSQTCFASQKRILDFIQSWETSQVSSQISKFETDLENGNISDLWIFILLKYYKDTLKSHHELKKILDYYKTLATKKDFVKTNKYILNYVFIGNNYLSSLIEEYDRNETQELSFEIETIYKQLIEFAKLAGTQYKNYFTYYKYACYKNIEYYNKKRLGKEITSKELENIINRWKTAIEKATRLFNLNNHHDYYEFDYIDSMIILSWDQIVWQINKVWSPYLYSIIFDVSKKKADLERISSLLDRSEWDLRFRNKFGDIEDKIDNSKIEAMTIVGIFTGIVVYSLWTIQIFTVIETVWSAWLFTWWFLSGILFLIGSIFYKIGRWIRYNKWLHLICLWFVILLLSFIWKSIFDSETLNANRGEDIHNRLNIKVQEAKQLKDALDERIKSLEKLQNNNTKISSGSIK